jgi:hypothetical protein
MNGLQVKGKETELHAYVLHRLPPGFAPQTDETASPPR